MKREYSTPLLEVLGELHEVTAGLGLSGRDFVLGLGYTDSQEGSS